MGPRPSAVIRCQGGNIMKSTLRLLFVCLLTMTFCTAASGESLSLPESLEEIQEEAFAGCENLSGVLVIPTDVQVAENAFDNTPRLTVLRGIAVVGDESTPRDGTLNREVWTAVAAFCEARNLDCTYTTDAAAALQNGYDVIITVGFLASDAVNLLQTQHPDARFICLDAEVDHQQDNVYCVQYNTEQSGFMAGYAAVRMGYRSLGFLGGIDIPDVVSFGNGFILGANQAAAEQGIEEKVTVARAYTGTFAPEPAVYETAASWYDKGAEIIFCCGGDMCQAVIQAANEKNALMIGVDSDQSHLGRAVVTSAMKNLGFSATDALARILNGSWADLGGTSVRLGVVSADPDQNHVCLAPNTQFGGGFTATDYAAMVASLYRGTYPSGGIAITVTPEPYLPRVAVVGDEPNPGRGTLDWDVKTAVSAFCGERNIDFIYITDAAAALQNGYDVIITVGFMASDAVNSLQTQHPDARFICLDSTMENQQENNVYCVQYDSEQSGFMAGYAAVRMGYRSLGFLGGMAIPDVIGFGDGFIAGANQAAAELGITGDVTVARAYTGTFAPEPIVYQKAASWYDQGIEIIFSCGGSMCQAVIQAADEKNGRMIGVDSDQSHLGSAVVTSAMKNMGFSATDALTHILSRDWSSLGGTSPRLGVISKDPSENHVCLAPNTQFDGGFTSTDYAAMVASLYRGTYPSGQTQINVTEDQEDEEPVIVSSSAELQALGDTLTGTVIVVSVNDEPVDLNWPVTLAGELRVETGDSHFSSLRILEGGSLTLAEGSFVQTLSDWDPATGTPNAVAQVWVNGGTLNAALGTIADYSTVYIRSGFFTLAEGADGVYLIGGAMDEQSLRTFLSDPRMDELFLEGDMILTDDVTLPCNTQIMSQAAVTVPNGVTLTVCTGCVLNVTDGTLTIATGGELVIEDGAQVYGDVHWEQAP